MAEWEDVSDWEDVQPPPSPSLASRGQDFASGGNKLLANLAGLPVDLATNVANIGIAGLTKLRNDFPSILRPPLDALGFPDYPNLIGPQFLGSESIKKGVEETVGSPVMTPANQDALGQNLNMAGGIVTSGVLAPAQSAPQMFGNMLKMAPSAAAAVAADGAILSIFPNI